VVTGADLSPCGSVLQSCRSRARCPIAPYARVEAAMAQRKQKKSPSTSSLPPPLATVNRHAAGSDVGAGTHAGAVPPPDDPQPVRGCGACTADLEALADW
jgi:hypothetical protein